MKWSETERPNMILVTVTELDPYSPISIALNRGELFNLSESGKIDELMKKF